MTETAPSATTTEAAASSPSKAKKVFSLVAFIVVACAAFFFGGWMRAHNVAEREAEATAEVLAEARAETAAAEERADAAEARAEAAQHAIVQLEARRLIAQALTDLDDRNFGSARTRTERAATLLQDQGEAMDDLATRLDALELLATEQLADERAALLAIARAFDEAVTPAAP